MPIVTPDQDIEQAPLIPATVAPTPQQTPSFGEVRDAAFAQSNIVGSALEKYTLGGYTSYPAVPNYDPYSDNGADIKGYEQYADRFTRSQSPAETQSIKNQIDAETSDRQTLAQAGTKGYVASLAAGATDPIFLTSQLIPGVGEAADVGRLAKVGSIVAGNVAAGEAQSAALAANSQTGSYTAGMLPRIATNALLAGVLGGIATRIPRPELDAAAAEADRRINGPVIPAESTAGAAAVPTTTLAQESVAPGGQTIAKSLGRISPVTRIMTNSAVPEARQLAQQLVDVPYLLNKNLEGVATPTSAEMRINAQENLRNATLFQEFDRQYTDYKTGGGELSKAQFSSAVADAMRSGDTHEIPQVTKLAAFTRPMFTQDRSILSELGMMPEGDNVVGAPSYFPRVYDKAAVLNHQTDLEDRLRTWFTQNPVKDDNGLPVDREPAEIQASVRNTVDHILGTVSGTADFGQGVKNPNVMKGRVLDVPDAILKPYLSSDFEHVMGSYNRSIIPQIEVRKTFGDATLERQFQAVQDAYNVKQSAATTDEGKAALSKQMKADMNDLTLLRDRLLGQTGPRLNQSLQFVRAAQLVKSWNYLRMLGTQTLSALPDVGRLVARYGLLNTGKRVGAFLLSSEAHALTKADAQRMATALDGVLHTRAHSLDGVGDELAGSSLTNRMQNATARFTQVTGIAAWDSAMRALSSQLEQDALFRLVNKGNASILERAKLASHGIGTDDLPAIRAQWDQFGSDESGLNRARTDLWTDRDAAQKVEQAVQRAASSNAFFVGKGDMPAFTNGTTGKLLAQFRSFSIASINRLSIPLAQGLAHHDVAAANGLMVMLTLGAMTSYLKNLAYGQTTDFSHPGQLMADAVQRSGVLSYLPDLYNLVASPLHLPVTSKFRDLDPWETLLGPSYGTGSALYATVQQLSGGKLTKSDLHKLRTLLPYQNYFLFARLANALEGKTEDALNVKGAPGRPFADYFNPTKDTAPKVRDDKTHFLGDQSIPNSF
ncbi:MAG TPA: hypothetical protein VHY36_11120 [Steroidobacteraceae bacterium]|jgi:hypothetical protein|nr:hypothetical protein [Steroidobacteraceae bacterium]